MPARSAVQHKGIEVRTVGPYDGPQFVIHANLRKEVGVGEWFEHTGIAWRHLPQEMGCSPATAHRRLAEWQAAGVWERLHRELLRGLNAAGRIDWSTSVVDGSHIRALLGGSTPGPRRLTVPALAQSTI